MNTDGNMNDDEWPWVSVTWVAARAGVSASTVYRWLAADGGGLRIHRINGRCSVVHRDEAIAWVDARAA